MIQEFVDRFIAAEDDIRRHLAEKHPDDYVDLVRLVVDTLSPDRSHADPDPNRIHQINDSDFQGTLVFVIAERSYQPDSYWFVKVYYGSCSGCDTLQRISNYSSEPPTVEQVGQYWTLCLHIVQGLKEMS